MTNRRSKAAGLVISRRRAAGATTAFATASCSRSYDSRGQVIGFGGRVLGTRASPSTSIRRKRRCSRRAASSTAFSSRGRRSATPARCVVVEGYMDVVALAQHGVELRGRHARHRDHAGARAEALPADRRGRLLLRRRRRGAQGGVAGAGECACRSWRRQERGFLFLPDGEDPDDFVRQRGKAAFEALVDGAVPLSEFLLAELRRAASATSAEGRGRPGDGRAPLVSRSSRRRCWRRCTAADACRLPEPIARAARAADESAGVSHLGGAVPTGATIPQGVRLAPRGPWATARAVPRP